jgi:hypothetical protein
MEEDKADGGAAVYLCKQMLIACSGEPTDTPSYGAAWMESLNDH